MIARLGLDRWRTLLAVACLGLCTACNSWPHTRNQPTAPPVRFASAQPTAQEIVAYLNENSKRVQSIEFRDVELDCTERTQSVGLSAVMVCQRPRNLRMSAKLMGNTAVDLGSNDQEFWYWISKANPPYLFHCAHQDYAQGKARMPFPFQPDWIMETLGLSEYDPSKNYEVAVKGNVIELVESTRTPQGQPVRKVAVLQRTGQGIHVTGHMLQDEKGKEICVAQILEYQQDRQTGAVVPKRVQLTWPNEQIKLKMKLDGMVVNQAMDNAQVARLFTRPQMRDVQNFDLARGLESNDRLQTTGGYR